MQGHKFVNDLGVGAYVLMHGYEVAGKNGRSIYFECSESEEDHFDSLVIEYQPPNEFYLFDSCLMYIKKMEGFESKIPREMDPQIHKFVTDLGAAAYLLLMEHRPNSLGVKFLGRKGKYVYFQHPEGKSREFEKMCFQYCRTQFQTYDSSLMTLKKIGELSMN